MLIFQNIFKVDAVGADKLSSTLENKFTYSFDVIGTVTASGLQMKLPARKRHYYF